MSKAQKKKSYAERIASFLEKMEPMFPNPQAAAELRRLHQVNQELVQALEYHQEQTRPVQQTIEMIAKHKEQE